MTETRLTYLKIHLLELFTPFDQKRRADVQVELRKGVGPFGQISIPHPYRALDADFSHQETVHPPECELHKLYSLFFHMLSKRRCFTTCISIASYRQLNSIVKSLTVDSLDQLSHSPHRSVYSRLCGYIIVLDSIEELGETPKRVGLDGCEDM